MDKKKAVNGLLIGAAALTAGYAVSKFAVDKKAEKSRKELNKDNPHLKGGESVHKKDKKSVKNRKRKNFYERSVKEKVDSIMAYCGIIALSPVLLGVSAAIYIDDPGPIFFKQKRIGENKEYFELYKFRSMKMSTPHDMPTHMLENPEQYITRVGKFLRKSSLDELPQLFNIYMNQMSVIGPRPALWNQDDLIAERDKYGANDVKPGLTGWAQINGRDELEIPVKAKLDGDYVNKLHSGSVKAAAMDAKCFLGTVLSVLRHDGVVEGGTGEMHKAENSANAEDAGFDEYAFKKKFNIDKTAHKRILITGADSYIGTSFEKWAEDHYGDNFEIDTIDMIDGTWREADFSKYDAVFHVAGLAHADVGKVSEETKAKYYAVNTDLAIETAEKAKAEGVKQFVFMSSMIIYGESAGYGKTKVIGADTVPEPANFYGDSKWQADKGVRALQTDEFKVAVVRPPMIYGRGSKGNYPTLAKLAKKLPVFPDVENKRSMLHIDNLCEFLCLLMLSGENGVYFPQNKEYTKTSDMVKTISHVCEKNICNTKILNPAVAVGSCMPGKIGGMVNKAFGNMVYEQGISRYEGMEYRVNALKESVNKTECKLNINKTKVLFLVNHEVVIYNFRLEIVEALLDRGYEVHISSPYGEKIKELQALGAVWHDIDIDRHGMDPRKEIKMINEYKRLYEKTEPDIILGFTIKPNIYGAIAAKKVGIPFVANITGLGTAVEDSGWKQKIFIELYKYAFTDIQRVFFQNTENQQFFIDNNISVSKHKLLPGSGVNLERFCVQEYPDDTVIRFAFISRIMKEKGIDQYLDAAQAIKQKYPNTEFHICGFCEAEYEGKLYELNENGTVVYHGMINNVNDFLKDIHCVIHPTYYPEGLSNVLLEACASGRPIITTDRSGCREVVDDEVNGFVVEQKNSETLIEAIEKFLALSCDERKMMGLAGRNKVEKEFDRQIVVKAYLKEIECQ